MFNEMIGAIQFKDYKIFTNGAHNLVKNPKFNGHYWEMFGYLNYKYKTEFNSRKRSS